MISSSSLTRLQRENPLFGQVLEGVSMVVHEHLPQNSAREKIEQFRPLIARRSLIKRRDDPMQSSAAHFGSQSDTDDIAPWGGVSRGGGTHASQKSVGIKANLILTSPPNVVDMIPDVTQGQNMGTVKVEEKQSS
jgi:hypothetical protein